MYALGDEATGRKVAEAHQAGVRAAVVDLDNQVGARTGRHGVEHVQGEGLLTVGFTHRTLRAGDPLLHTHLIITNRMLGPDGVWRTLDSRDLLAHRATADAMYRAAYQRELSRWLGVRWDEPDRWGNRAIVGMPEELAITGQVARQYAVYASVTQPGSPPGAILAAWYGSWPWFLDLALALVFTPLLFPTGTTGTGTGLIFTSVAWNHQAGRTLHTGAAG